MNKKILKVLVVSALLNCGISSFIATPYVEAKELKPSINQSIEHQKEELKFKLYDEIQDAITILDNHEETATVIMKKTFRKAIDSAVNVYLDEKSDISKYKEEIDSLKLYKRTFKLNVSKLIKNAIKVDAKIQEAIDKIQGSLNSSIYK